MAVIAQLDGKRIDALSLAEDDWFGLKESDDRKRLAMPICGIRAVAKNRGPTQFFSHYRVTECGVDHGGESSQHQAMKAAIAHAIDLVPGWSAEIEHPHPSREWIIDIMAVSDDGRKRFAFEVQLSGQTPEEYQRRSQRYFDSGYMPVWLIARDLEYSEIKVPTLTTGFGKTSDIPDSAVDLLRLPVSSSNLDLRVSGLGAAIRELLERGHNWRHGSPSRQAEKLTVEKDERAREHEEAERRRAEW
ncbi:competence protein CoiA family protein [Arthrobacter sp. MDT2-16]